MKVLVMGAAGQIGRELMLANWGADIALVGLYRPLFDIADAESVKSVIVASKANVVINAAAYTAVENAETDAAAAFAVNEQGAAHAATVCGEMGVPLIQISTDYVFDGKGESAYVESDATSPVNIYGRSKAAGEAAVRLHQPQHVILRTSWVYASHGQNFVRAMLRVAAEREEITVVDDQFGTPTSAATIASALTVIAKCIALPTSGAQSIWGTYHFTAQGETTWHGFAEYIFVALAKNGRKRPRLKAIPSAGYKTAAKRPTNSRLDCTLFDRTFRFERKRWEQDVDQVLEMLLAQDATGA